MMAHNMQPQNMNMNMNMNMSTMQRPQSGNMAQQLHARIVSSGESGLQSECADHTIDGRAPAQGGSASRRLAVDIRYWSARR